MCKVLPGLGGAFKRVQSVTILLGCVVALASESQVGLSRFPGRAGRSLDCACCHTCFSSSLIRTPLQELREQPVFATLSHYLSGNQADSSVSLVSYSKYLPCVLSPQCIVSLVYSPCSGFLMPVLTSMVGFLSPTCSTYLPARPAPPPTQNLCTTASTLPSRGFPLELSKNKPTTFALFIILEIPPNFLPPPSRVPRPAGFSSRPSTNSTYQ